MISHLKSILSKAIGRFLYKRGYVLLPLSEVKLTARLADNFSNLCGAYEKRLGELSPASRIPASGLRAGLMARQLGTPPSEAYYIVGGLAETQKLGGDVCEFGVAQGEISALIASEILGSGRHFHLFDSFEGLPKPSEKDLLKDDIFSLGSMEVYTGQMASPEKLVRERLRAVNFPEERVHLHKGFFENLLPARLGFPSKVSFAYVDFDFYEPIKLALAYLDETAIPGAIFVVDDYDFFSTGVKLAVDEFLAERKLRGQPYGMHVPSTHYGHFAVIKKLAASNNARNETP